MKLVWMLILLLTMSGWAEDEMLAKAEKSVVLVIRLGYRIHHGDVEIRRLASPRVNTRDGTEAEISVDNRPAEGAAGGKDNIKFTVKVTPTVMADNKRVRLKLAASIERPQGGPLRQYCQLTGISGEAVEFSVQPPENDEEYTVEVIPYVVMPDQKLEGFDKDGKPILR